MAITRKPLQIGAFQLFGIIPRISVVPYFYKNLPFICPLERPLICPNLSNLSQFVHANIKTLKNLKKPQKTQKHKLKTQKTK